MTCKGQPFVLYFREMKKNKNVAGFSNRSPRPPQKNHLMAHHLPLLLVVNSEKFWGACTHIRTLGLLLRTCHSIKQECDIMFALEHIPLAAECVVSKVWAKRWLGLCDHWMSDVKQVTLLMALEISMEHGGVCVTMSRGSVFREREQVDRVKRRKRVVENGLCRKQFVSESEAVLCRHYGVPIDYFKNELGLHYDYYATSHPVDFAAFGKQYTEEQLLTASKEPEHYKILDAASWTLLKGPSAD